MKQKIEAAIKKVLKDLGLPQVKFSVEHPENMVFGDYSTNVGIITHKTAEIVARLKAEPTLKKMATEITTAGPGFINISVQPAQIINVTKRVITDKFATRWSGKKYLLEHTSPNPNKAMHLGHLRNNVTGMAIANIFEAVGVKVIRDCIDNNRGIAIAKLMWGYLKFAHKQGKKVEDINYWFKHQDEWQTPEDAGLTPDKFVDELYVKGNQDMEDKTVEKKVRQMVIDWEAGDKINRALWQKVLDYSYQGQQLVLKRLGNKWDKVWHEHEHFQQGKDLVIEGLKKGIFQKSQRAIVTDLKKYGLPDTVVIKADGTALYITQDLALTRLKIETFKPDKLFWVIGPEQSLALKQMFAVCEQLGIVKYSDCTHVAYGYMSIKGQGKMSSRTGNVIYINDLLDQAKQNIKSNFKCSDEIAEAVGVGAVKYSILKVERMQNMAFDVKKSVSLEGNSGPYLQYTFARAKSVLEKNGKFGELKNVGELNQEEDVLLRTLYQFEEVVVKAADELSPNLIANFIYDVAQKFNSFYNKHRIVGNDFRLWLTEATAEILKRGLNLLGISAPEKM